MGKTISTHNGSVANRDHNIRNPYATDKQEHIEKSLQGNNEILHDEKPREAYERIFGKALADYNAKQTREDRKIKSYYNHINADEKKHAVYEMIVQIGDRKDTGINAPEERACLKEFYEGWKERNPNLECIGAYIHADEKDGTLHMHVDYVPVAHGYQRGLETQNGLVKALQEQGFEKQGKATAQIQWEARENRALEEICRQHGIEVEHPASDKREHMRTEQYKVYAELKETKKELATLQKKTDRLEGELQRAKDGSVSLPQLASKKTAAEIQRQNEALRREVNRLQNQNASLQGENDTLKAKEQERAERVHDRTSTERKSLDALDKQEIFENWRAKVREKAPDIDKVLNSYDRQVASAEKYGRELVGHKRGYVECVERSKTLQNEIKSLQEKKSTLQAETTQISSIEGELGALRQRLALLEQERSNCSTLQIVKKRDLDKQMKACSEDIQKQETVLKDRYGMFSTDSATISDEVHYRFNELEYLQGQISDKSLERSQMDEQAKEHLQTYQSMVQTKKSLTEPAERIVDRYDKEYEPPAEHKLALSPFRSRAKGKEQEQTRGIGSMKEYEEIISKRRATDFLQKKEQEPKPKTHEQVLTR